MFYVRRAVAAGLVDLAWTQPPEEFWQQVHLEKKSNVRVMRWLRIATGGLGVIASMTPTAPIGRACLAVGSITGGLLEFKQAKFTPNDWNQRSSAWIYPAVCAIDPPRTGESSQIIKMHLALQMLQGVVAKGMKSPHQWVQGETLGGLVANWGQILVRASLRTQPP